MQYIQRKHYTVRTLDIWVECCNQRVGSAPVDSVRCVLLGGVRVSKFTKILHITSMLPCWSAAQGGLQSETYTRLAIIVETTMAYIS